MKEIRGEELPQPVGAYSVAVESDAKGFIFLSGQLPIKDGQLLKGDFKEQVKAILENCKKILEAAGSSLDKVVKVTVFISDMDKFGVLNEIYTKYFKPPYPARAVVEVSRLPKDADIEIEMIAEK